MTYNKGSAAERELKKKLEAKGYFVVRASGSGADGVSPDLIALHTTNKIAIECKYWKNNLFIEKPKFKIMQAWERTTGVPVFVAWKQARKGWHFFPLTVFNEARTGFTLNTNELNSGMTIEEVTTTSSPS